MKNKLPRPMPRKKTTATSHEWKNCLAFSSDPIAITIETAVNTTPTAPAISGSRAHMLPGRITS